MPRLLFSLAALFSLQRRNQLTRQLLHRRSGERDAEAIAEREQIGKGAGREAAQAGLVDLGHGGLQLRLGELELLGDGQHHGVGHLLHRVVEGIKKVASHGKLHDDKAEAKQA